jgi:hypothetical protein
MGGTPTPITTEIIERFTIDWPLANSPYMPEASF